MKLWWMMVNMCLYIPSKNKNFNMQWKRVKNFLLSKNTKIGSKKFLAPFHTQLKFFCLLHMIAHSYPYHSPRNKNFSMLWNRAKNFLLTQNSKFDSKKFLTPFHTQIKLWNFGELWQIHYSIFHQDIKILACTHPEIEIFYCPKTQK